MFVWGSGHKTLRVSAGQATSCSHCGRFDTCSAVIDYDYSHIFWAFKGLKNMAVTTACEACGVTAPIDKLRERELFTNLGRNPIPFMDRYGAYVLVAIVVGWVIIVLAFPCAVNPTSELCTR
jgi:hypothetical protein